MGKPKRLAVSTCPLAGITLAGSRHLAGKLGGASSTNDLVLEYAAKLTGQVLDPAKVIPASGSIETGQALQLPLLQFFAGMQEDDLGPEIEQLVKQFLEQAGNRERIVVELGDVAEVRALICANAERKVTEFMLLRAFDAQNQVVEEIKLPGHTISSFAQLPAAWQDAAGPWQSDVRRVFDLLRRHIQRHTPAVPGRMETSGADRAL